MAAEILMASPANATDMFRLDGRIAFVSGAAGHLGRAMTLALAGAGAHVIVNGRNDARLKDFEGELRGLGYSAERAAFDVASILSACAHSSRAAPGSTFS